MTTYNSEKIKNIKVLVKEVRGYGSLSEVEEGISKLEDQLVTIENLDDPNISDENISGALEGMEKVLRELLRLAVRSHSLAKQQRINQRIR